MDVPRFLKKKQVEKTPSPQTNTKGASPQPQVAKSKAPPNGEVSQTATASQKPHIPSATIAFGQKQMPLIDILSPQSLEIDFSFIKINDVYFRTLFIAGYPRFVSPGWLEPIVAEFLFSVCLKTKEAKSLI